MAHDDTVETITAEHGRSRRWGSRVALAVLGAIVILGSLSFLGVQTESVEATNGDYRLHVDYPRVARPGLDVEWRVQVTREAGFGKTLTLAASADQFDIYEAQAFYPEPDQVTRTATDVLMTFAAPPGDTFVLTFDAYVQPSSQSGRDATIAVVDEGERVAEVRFTTWLAP